MNSKLIDNIISLTFLAAEDQNNEDTTANALGTLNQEQGNDELGKGTHVKKINFWASKQSICK